MNRNLVVGDLIHYLGDKHGEDLEDFGIVYDIQEGYAHVWWAVDDQPSARKQPLDVCITRSKYFELC